MHSHVFAISHSFVISGGREARPRRQRGLVEQTGQLPGRLWRGRRIIPSLGPPLHPVNLYICIYVSIYSHI